MGDMTEREAEMTERMHKLLRRAGKMRGEFVDQAIWVDTLLSEIIALHLCPDKRRKQFLFSTLLGGQGVGLRVKTDVFIELLRDFCPDVLEKHPKLRADLRKVAEFRNKLAHHQLDTSEERLQHPIGDSLYLVTWRRGKETFYEITKGEFASELRRVEALVYELRDIHEEVARWCVDERQGQDVDGST